MIKSKVSIVLLASIVIAVGSNYSYAAKIVEGVRIIRISVNPNQKAKTPEGSSKSTVLTLAMVGFDKKTGTINRYLASYPNITIPKVLDGVTVKKIGEEAFAFNNLTSVTIPDSVTTIGEGAFNVNVLSTINNAPSDGFIFARNEDGTENKKVVISYGGATKELTIPDSVTIIEEMAFDDSVKIKRN